MTSATQPWTPSVQRFLVVGDLHGDIGRLQQILSRARRELHIHAALHVGDLGLDPLTLRHWLDQSDPRMSVPVIIVDGNHDDHAWLAHLRQHPAEAASLAAIGLQVQDRGALMHLGGITLGCCGGALHPDRPQVGAEEVLLGREPTTPNWVTPAQARAVASSWASDPPDIVLAHSCPAGIGIGLTGSPTFAAAITADLEELGLPAIASNDVGEPGLTMLWSAVPRPPRHWICGHFHRFHQSLIGRTQVTVVPAADGQEVLPVVLDTTHLNVEVHPVWEFH